MWWKRSHHRRRGGGGGGCDKIGGDTISFPWGTTDKCCEAAITFFRKICIVTLFWQKNSSRISVRRVISVVPSWWLFSSGGFYTPIDILLPSSLHPVLISYLYILSWHSTLTFYLNILSWHPLLTFSLDILSWHPHLTSSFDILSWHSHITSSFDIRSWHFIQEFHLKLVLNNRL